jgi:hypothetical protein
MGRLQSPVACFLLAASLPFVLCYAVFLYAQRASLLTPPDVYIDRLKREGQEPYMVSLRTWKYMLARDRSCASADVVVIGSSHLRELDERIVGAPTCNLYVDGLNAPMFELIVTQLPAVTPGRRRVAYVGLHHRFFWWPTPLDDTIDVRLFDVSSTLWRFWRVVRPLAFFSISDLRESVRRQRAGPGAYITWFPDGHAYFPGYYADKAVGIHTSWTAQEVDKDVDEYFRGTRVRAAFVGAFLRGTRSLRAKGYTVNLFWEPLGHAFVTHARHRYGEFFERPIEAVERMTATLPVDRYLAAQETLDAGRFACRDDDSLDQLHVDVDCMSRFFARTFPRDPTVAGPTLSRELSGMAHRAPPAR